MTENQTSWKTVFDSVRGTSHETNDQPCQDCCRVVPHFANDKEVLIAACADGAGSAEQSDEGSRIACDMWVELCKSYVNEHGIPQDINQELISGWLQQIREAIIVKAQQYEIEVRQMATTLLGCVITADGSLFVQIGDGAMIFHGEECFEYAFWPHSGEYANMTNFLTSDDFAEKFEWKIVKRPIDEFVAFTDGLERLILKFEDQTVHDPAIIPMLNAIQKSETGEEFFEPLRGFLNSDSVNERTDDDKTLILATRLTDDEAGI